MLSESLRSVDAPPPASQSINWTSLRLVTLLRPTWSDPWGTWRLARHALCGRLGCGWVMSRSESELRAAPETRHGTVGGLSPHPQQRPSKPKHSQHATGTGYLLACGCAAAPHAPDPVAATRLPAARIWHHAPLVTRSMHVSLWILAFLLVGCKANSQCRGRQAARGPRSRGQNRIQQDKCKKPVAADPC
jgi:hypothetical protein